MLEEFEVLRRELQELALSDDDESVARYTMRRPGRPPGLYWQSRWLAGRIVRWLQSLRILPSNPWPIDLTHATRGRGARPVVLWAVGTDRQSLRDACRGFAAIFETLPGFAPVLITDVADFAYFSRLGWLVEYLPTVHGTGEAYDKRKAKYLARLYRDAPALPVSAGLAAEESAAEIRRWVKRRS